jgi:hypothetical protein
MLFTKLVIPVVTFPLTVPNVPDDEVVNVAAGMPENSAGMVVENTAGKVSRRAPQNNHLKKLPPAS